MSIYILTVTIDGRREAPASTLQFNTITSIAAMSACGRCGERWAAVCIMPGRMRAPGSTSVSHAAPQSAHVEMDANGRRRWVIWLRHPRTPCCHKFDPHRIVQRPWEDSDYHHGHRCEEGACESRHMSAGRDPADRAWALQINTNSKWGEWQLALPHGRDA